MHLTNYSLNKSSKTFIDETEVEDILEPNSCSKRTLMALWKQLTKETGDEKMAETIKANIKDTCAATMSLLINFMQATVNPHNPDATSKQKFKSKAYQVFGFDILIDKNLKAWLLEINEAPSMCVIHCPNPIGCNHTK